MTRSSGGLLRAVASGAVRLGVTVALVLVAQPALAQDKARITALTDLAFGTITNLASDAVRTENICVYSSSALNNYRVTGTGSGSGNAFSLTSGSNSLSYEVQWSQLSGQSSGTQLTAGTALTGQHSTASQQSCNAGPATSASLIVILRAAALQSALSGSYSGTLSLVIAPE
jgi:hypothetical protein